MDIKARIASVFKVFRPITNRANEYVQPFTNRVNRYVDSNTSRIPVLQLVPGLFWVLGLLVLSLVIIVIYSFIPSTQNISVSEFSLLNYREFLNTRLYIQVLWDSFVVGLKTTVLGLIIGYPVAYYLAFMDVRWRYGLLVLIILPFWMNYVIRTYAWRLILGRKGMLNYLLYDLTGLLDSPTSFLFSELAVMIGLVHVFLPFFVLPLYANLSSLDPSHREAAKNLGANKLETFIEVTLPLSMPGIVTSAVLVFVLAFGSFVIPQLLGGNQFLMIGNIIADMFTGFQNWPLGSAISIVFVSIIIVIVYALNKVAGLGNIYSGDESS
jgi:ABC-type spermidine/putrescine transport system permease subunit I